MDQFSLITNLTTIFLIYSKVDLYKIRIVASMAVVALWIQMFFWFRLFDNLAQYVDLIFQTTYDIKNFIFVLLSLMFMFGSGLYLLNINRSMYPNVNDPIYPYEESFGSMFSASMYN